MSFFSRLKAMTEESHGNAIYTELHDKLRRLRAHNQVIVQTGLLIFHKRIEGQQEALLALPHETKISTGTYLQSQGREMWDSDLPNAISLFFSGAWLESSARPGMKAAEAHRLLAEILSEYGRLSE